MADHSESVALRRESLEQEFQSENDKQLVNLTEKLDKAQANKTFATEKKLANISGDHAEQVGERQQQLVQDSEKELECHVLYLEKKMQEAKTRREHFLAQKGSQSPDHTEAVRIRREELRQAEEARLDAEHKHIEEQLALAVKHHNDFLEARKVKAVLMQ